jgi:hypothetical protein
MIKDAGLQVPDPHKDLDLKLGIQPTDIRWRKRPGLRAIEKLPVLAGLQGAQCRSEIRRGFTRSALFTAGEKVTGSQWSSEANLETLELASPRVTTVYSGGVRPSLGC